MEVLPMKCYNKNHCSLTFEYCGNKKSKASLMEVLNGKN